MVANRFFSTSLSLVLSLTSLLALSACTSVDNVPNDTVRSTMLSTQSMGKGYRYQDSTPLSSPAPSSPWVRSAVIHDTEKMSASTAAWQGAVYELVAQIEPTLPKDGTPINLTSKGAGLTKDINNASLDHYLRQSLIQRGYNLTTVPDAGLPVTHQVKKSKTPRTYDISMTILDAKGKAVHTETVPAVLPE